MGQRQFPYWKWAGLRWLVLGAGVLQLVSLAMQINDWIELAGSGFQPFEPAVEFENPRYRHVKITGKAKQAYSHYNLPGQRGNPTDKSGDPRMD